MRAIMPRGRYLITACGWSIGAYTAETHPEWKGNKNLGLVLLSRLDHNRRVEIPVLKAVGDQIDIINVMLVTTSPLCERCAGPMTLDHNPANMTHGLASFLLPLMSRAQCCCGSLRWLLEEQLKQGDDPVSRGT